MTEVKQLIVLGNGFDLASGLKSSYGDFLDWELETHNLTIESVENVLSNITANSLNTEQESVLSLNIWLLLLIHSKLSKESNWKNFEEKMSEYLEDELLECISTCGGKANFFVPNHQKSTAVLPLVNKIINHTNKNFDYSLDSIFNYFMANLNLLEKDFEHFLFHTAGYDNDIDANNYGDITYFDAARYLLSLITNADIDTTEYFPQYNIMCFNYTDPWDNRWVSPFGVNGPIKSINIHGQAMSVEDNINRIIFGIDSKNINAINTKYPFTKTFRTFVNYSDTRKSQGAIMSNVFDKDITIIKFFGHSLGEADYSYFQQMFDYYDLYNNDKLILYFYFSNYNSREIIQCLQEQVQMVSQLIEKYGETMANKDHGKNLLTRLEITKRIFIKELHIDFESLYTI